ncbi:hypothetical protein CYMTET_29024 [Cymbomonas tetramitiformis]|uniref:Uncharacterized protein n=1 Tax=Cymbomonas tetramitiformis TaxID=36881 RepID=A0AAE0FLN0_9CHLO|nr:hypothetical protein CYMTET_29024 [Cymbomonas tetramitiformis]
MSTRNVATRHSRDGGNTRGTATPTGYRNILDRKSNCCQATQCNSEFDSFDYNENSENVLDDLDDDAEEDRLVVPHYLHFFENSPEVTGGADPDETVSVEEHLRDNKPVCVGHNLAGECVYLNASGASTQDGARRSLLARDGTGDMYGVDPIADGGNKKYYSEMCKTPPSKLNPPDFDYMNYGGAILPDSVDMPGVSAASGNVSTAGSPSARRLLAVKRSRPSRSRKKKGGGGKFRIPGWTEGHPNKRDFQLFDWMSSNLAGYCPYATKNCVKPDHVGKTTAFIRGPAFACCQKKDKSCCTARKQIFVDTEPMPKTEWEGLPSIEKGRWGSCAYVALGDNLLKNERGAEIDNHDLVIRLGHAPLGKWSKFVGKKTDVVVSRGASTRMQKKDVQDNIKFYIGASPVYLKDLKALKHWVSDYDPIKVGDVGENMSPRVFPGQIYQQMTSPLAAKPRGPTTGFIMIIQFLMAQYCKRLDLYGFSSNGGPPYYGEGASMKIHHSCELESWSLHYLMKNKPKLNMCVHL